MTRPLRAAGALLALALSLPALAQLKLPSSGAPATGTRPAASSAAAASAPAAAASAPAASSAHVEKEKAGQLAAAGWLTLLDRRDWGTAWETSASTFRKAVPLPNWLEGAPKARADFGPLQERTPAAVSYKDRLDRQPPGDYVTVVFVSKYEKRGEVEEMVTTVREADGRWRVMGYLTR
ncbi:DUF4019 domain-containing protein [Ramlibacter sp. Leaf400]|uniref:DUF4019 domain-containing protein n=1 Tax=Ramlibacter sp. Leaf400 TaxID=1736365 RepID=UPI0006F69A0C|nr:DUF4019 domain-containing protein [Ramlibacter sp. Leaf400]KQT08013.1 hypothetical protein ASG30_16410 [Ramlibacter sp. Leaf400]